MENGECIGHIRRDEFLVLHELCVNLFAVERLNLIKVGVEYILEVEHMVDLLHQVLFAAEQLADLKADLCVLIGIERCDAALGGTKGLRSQTGFFHAVECLVVRHNDLAAVGDEDVRHRNALFRYSLELVDEVFNGERNAVANDIEDVLSKNDKVSTKAQISNPWSTEEFNREREKLFYLALQMTKEFVLSSKSCRTNLCILGQYWGFRTENDTDRIKFHKQDREAMIASLFQTLFLITPVISSTFASVGRLLRDMKTPGCIGTLVIDEAGQAQPQMAVGALYRARKAIIVGDPKQVEPVVTDDLKLLKEAYSEPVFANYKNKSLSVQSCADIMNPFGTSYDNGTDYPDWVGCPLLVHRRCISPMYEISNRISYNGIMKQQTLPPSDGKVESFIYEKSQWINVTGVENGHGDHYVAEQGNVVCEMVNVSFQKAIKISKMQVDTKPSLYIITPFTTVVSGLRKAIGTYATRNKNSALGVSTSLDEWLYDNIGTVHKFQGKEANEVIFVLGCDESQKNRYAVKGFVNSNIVNVAATRAKYRFYMVGDQKVWGKNEYVNEAKSIMDRLLIEDAEENN